MYEFLESQVYDRPHDALDAGAAALDAVASLIGGHDDLHVIGHREVFGLTVILGAVSRVMTDAAALVEGQGAAAGDGRDAAGYRRGLADGRESILGLLDRINPGAAARIGESTGGDFDADAAAQAHDEARGAHVEPAAGVSGDDGQDAPSLTEEQADAGDGDRRSGSRRKTRAAGWSLQRNALIGWPKRSHGNVLAGAGAVSGSPLRRFSQEDTMTYETDGHGFALTASIPAAELARLKRRVAYLEAVAVQVMRGRGRIKEWFTAAELQALRLPGLPAALNAITRHAGRQNWRRRAVAGSGRTRYEYHFSTLPRRAFEVLLDRVLRPVGDGGSHHTGGSFATRATEPPAGGCPDDPDTSAHVAAEPPWLLPLMRIIRENDARTVGQAVERLAERLPDGVTCPSYGEAEQALQRLGMIEKDG